MTAFSTQTAVGELVKDRPARSSIFEQLKIDCCCGGKTSLAEAYLTPKDQKSVSPTLCSAAFSSDPVARTPTRGMA